MSQIIRVVDAFAAEPFSGNPAAVCLLEQPASEAWMQQVAREMNLSETAFVSPEGEGRRIRWFTPTNEMPICGHATLAASHVLWESGELEASVDAVFQSMSGPLRARRLEDGDIELDFPTYKRYDAARPDEIIAALGISARESTLFERPSRGDETWVFELESEEAVRRVAPRFDSLRASGMPTLIVSARAEQDDADIVSRYFSPANGIDEDPVTGSSLCALGPYWSPRLESTSFVVRQLSTRGGQLRASVRGERVGIAGSAVTVMTGSLHV